MKSKRKEVKDNSDGSLIKQGSIWDYVCTYVLLPTLPSKTLEDWRNLSDNQKASTYW